jgi:trans-aconitate methyltransferase
MEAQLTKNDFKGILEPDLSQYIQDKIAEYNFVHDTITDKDEQSGLLVMLMTEFDKELPLAGDHRQSDWEKGWEENLTSGNIIPKYFGKHSIVRWKQTLVKAVSPDYEINMLHLIVDWVADKYMRDAIGICEFGCGTGHNLQRVRLVNPDANLVGLDWAESSQEIIDNYAEKTGDINLFSAEFDFFNPDYDTQYVNECIIYTVASLEQTGERYTAFLDYLLTVKPCLCIHIEPVEELLDKKSLLDYTAIKYIRKRGYLTGFLTKLRNLESKGRVEILLTKRTYVGSLFIEGYSVIVWRPK